MDNSGSARLRICTDVFSRLLFEEACDGFFLANHAGHFVEVNRSGHNMLGYAYGELIGLHVREVFLPHDPERLHAAWGQLALGSTVQELWQMGRKDGSLVRLEASAQRLRNGSVFVVVRKQRGAELYEQALEQAEAKLIKFEEHAHALHEQLIHASKMESVGQLAGGVAHDFNNLLTTVAAFVELAQGELSTNGRLREYLDGVLAATTRGAELTRQLLAFARKKRVHTEITDLNALLKRMAPMLQRLLGEHIEVKLSLSPGLGTVKVDVGSIEQVILNLVVNARDAMPNGGTLTLETHDERAPGGARSVVLSVLDNGTGMLPEVRARVFEPFFTTKAPGHGTGLGLAMCQDIVQQVSGKLEVHSELAVGTRFTITLPHQQADGASAAEAPRACADTGNETVLVVEDEAMILRVAKTALERRGYRVFCAKNGAEALELARSTPARIDMLITDVVMPAIDGPELAARLTELRPEVKVLFTSGYAESQLGSHGVPADRCNFIQKPYTFALLAQRVRALLDAHA